MSEILFLKISSNAKIYANEVLSNPKIVELLLVNATSSADTIDKTSQKNCKEAIERLNLIISNSQLSS